LRRARLEFRLPADPTEGIRSFDTSQHRTYTREQPNALTAPELRDFLAHVRELYPQHYAMVFMGVQRVTGNMLGRGGGGIEILYEGEIPLNLMTRVR
jgi:hypothetical protein